MDYGMYTQSGNKRIEALVQKAKLNNLTWPAVLEELARLEKTKSYSECMDTEVREIIFFKLGFADQAVDFYS